MADPDNDERSDDETARRMEAALKRALRTPRKPHKSNGKSKASPKPKKRKSVTKKPGR